MGVVELIAKHLWVLVATVIVLIGSTSARKLVNIEESIRDDPELSEVRYLQRQLHSVCVQLMLKKIYELWVCVDYSIQESVSQGRGCCCVVHNLNAFVTLVCAPLN